MLEKRLFDSIFKKIRHGALKVRYWDGDERTYGIGTPYFTMAVSSPKALRAIIKRQTMGFGESYASGDISIEGSLIQVGRLVSENQAAFANVLHTPRLRRKNKNVAHRQKRYIQHHYDLGNDFYKLWLDEAMIYSCAYFRKQSDTLEVAQQQKIDHLLRKLQLKPGHEMLDIGSGWGTLLITAAKQYGISGLGITLSEEQLKHARIAAKQAGVDKQIRFELVNYQDLAKQGKQFDRIISVGMFEHVGQGNLGTYYKAVHDMLKDGGVTVLHTITTEKEAPNDPWIDKYIFPGGYLPSTREIVSALPDYQLRLLDAENLRLHYAMTLEEWQRRYHKHQKEVTTLYDEQFYRMWDLWLASSAAGFRYSDLNLMQFVLSKGVNNELPLTREHIYK